MALQFRRRGRHSARATEISVDDRFRIQDVLRSYVWANDSGSVEGVVAAFTPDGIVQPATEERIPVRRWASETFGQPGRRAASTGCSTLRSRPCGHEQFGLGWREPMNFLCSPSRQ